MENFDKEIIEFNINTIYGLEYLGVRFEDTKEEKGSCGLFSKLAYYYSVPELSTLEVKDAELNDRIKTANGLKYVAKEVLIDMMIKNYQHEFGEDEKFVQDVKENIHDYFKFYAKVRSGETWNKELAEQRMKELTKELQEASGYREI